MQRLKFWHESQLAGMSDCQRMPTVHIFFHFAWLRRMLEAAATGSSAISNQNAGPVVCTSLQRALLPDSHATAQWPRHILRYILVRFQARTSLELSGAWLNLRVSAIRSELILALVIDPFSSSTGASFFSCSSKNWCQLSAWLFLFYDHTSFVTVQA